jgi:general secretion pathway protein D
MNKAITRIISAACAAGLLASATAQQSTESPAKPAANESAVSPADSTKPAPAPAVAMPEPMPDSALNPGNPDEIRLNFRNAPLDLILNHLSEAAGFIVVMEAQVKGTVTVMSGQPLNRDEAVDLLNSVLGKNGYAAIRDGRTLTIVERSAAKGRNIPVKVSNDPAQIPSNEEIVTQIIPIRYVEAEQLARDLSTFVSSQATFVANAAGNSIVMTDTQSNIRHMVEIIRAIDTSAQSETEIRVFKLKNANPSDVATLLTELFSSSTSGTGNNQAPIRFGGGPGGFGGGGFPGFGGGGFGGFGGGGGGGRGGGGGNTAAAGSNDRIRKASQVISVADARTSSVVVTASKDLMTQIAGMVRELDVPSTRDQKVYVFHMENGDPQQAVQVLQNMFQGTGTARGGTGTSSSQQNSALMQRQQNNSSSSSATVNGGASSTFGGTGGRTGAGGGNQF